MSVQRNNKEGIRIESVFTGVGGQGIITMGTVLGVACSRIGLNIVTAETHGMSQRMGMVDFFVRIGDVEAPLVSLASADIVVSLEMIEALRSVRYLKKCGWLLLSNVYLPPPNVDDVPPKRIIIETLEKLPIKSVLIDVEEIVKKLKDNRVVNMTMLGAFMAVDIVSKIIPVAIVEDVVEEMLGSTNREAFIMGYEQALEKMRRGELISKMC
ncbi:2-oxoacid:acceptor oxidoreductase family protein [Ignisphaera sp. 4213-co]|uniref:2-oxoacid:acceptor oxidoreductase family protein n=1 Tax=Ignisphaera cupida TaxID=3050454 RepID=A0ABD4Z941_9CREN|nr:2-oxoacid:acceptor oxidoreductase family protein [Ignisphaera sp. 4213-co]MDK6029547.1 2-oxoacid:acceptor oxidoreductase family protein [Ignisphaera sp. 4213-co]